MSVKCDHIKQIRTLTSDNNKAQVEKKTIQ